MDVTRVTDSILLLETLRIQLTPLSFTSLTRLAQLIVPYTSPANMSDSDNKEENHSLLRDEEVSGDNRSLNNSVMRFQTSQRDTLGRLIVSLTSVILIFNTIAGVIGFFVGKAMVKEQYKSNIERKSRRF